MSKINIFKNIKDYLIITFGLILCCVGWVVFMLPNHITQGGLPGISSILFWGFGIKVQYTFFVLNSFLILFALKILGFKFCIKTIYVVIMVSLIVPIIQRFIGDTVLLSNQLFLAAVIGGGFMGTGVGLCLSANGSTGGTDVIAAMVNKYHDLSLGRIILITDIVVITASYLVLKDWEQVIYGYVVLFVSSYCVDWIVNMNRSSVHFFIMSERYEEIGKAINNRQRRGCTVIPAQGFYSGNDIKILFVLSNRSESTNIFALIQEIDPKAFVSQSSVIGVYGEGFDHFKISPTKKSKQVTSR